ncbi:MAG: POTRA domain-containing protein [Ferruginibacter sp.]
MQYRAVNPVSSIKKIFCLIIFLFVVAQVHSQKTKTPDFIFTDTALLTRNNYKVCIKELEVTGTKKTKVYIVHREIHFKKGDSLLVSHLQKELEQARTQVYNTSLFNEVKFELVALDSVNISIAVRVSERWYIYPIPQFKLVDRNFNEWWKTYNHSLSRVDYGLNLFIITLVAGETSYEFIL